jgi:hypothetical protein
VVSCVTVLVLSRPVVCAAAFKEMPIVKNVDRNQNWIYVDPSSIYCYSEHFEQYGGTNGRYMCAGIWEGVCIVNYA